MIMIARHGALMGVIPLTMPRPAHRRAWFATKTGIVGTQSATAPSIRNSSFRSIPKIGTGKRASMKAKGYWRGKRWKDL
jgi:hypothetical protein